MAHLHKSPSYEKIKSLSLCLVQKAFIWVIGGPGRPGTMGMYSHGVYRFNLQENVWDKMPSTNSGRLCPGCCEHDGHVFVFFGCNNHTIERIKVSDLDSDA